MIKIKSALDIPSYEITSESAYMSRRKLVSGMAGLSLAATVPSLAWSAVPGLNAMLKEKVSRRRETPFGKNEELTPERDALRYNNFYEFGTGKGDPAEYAGSLVTDPWSVKVEGFAEKTGTFALEDLLRPLDIEERIYRFRCVEAWSMVIPWVGFPLASLIKNLQPTSNARYVIFETLYRPSQMPGQRSVMGSIDWPYTEGLRMDEAMHPLAFMAIGMYGKSLQNQSGAPFRLVVPWKYGFKSIKSIVKIRFADKRDLTTWEKANPREYGFYSNVNPEVDHPRWSQKTERRLPGSLFSSNKIPTQKFNGYGEQVAGLYAGMDLKRYF